MGIEVMDVLVVQDSKSRIEAALSAGCQAGQAAPSEDSSTERFECRYSIGSLLYLVTHTQGLPR